MRQNMANVDAAKNIIDLRDKSILIAFDVEHRPLLHGIRARKSLSNIRKTIPHRLFRNAKPRVERSFEVTVQDGDFFKLFAADNMHAAPLEVRILRTLYFAKREDVNPSDDEKLVAAWLASIVEQG